MVIFMGKVSQDEFYRFVDGFGDKISSYVSSMSEPPVRLYIVDGASMAGCCVSSVEDELKNCKPSRNGIGFESSWEIF